MIVETQLAGPPFLIRDVASYVSTGTDTHLRSVFFRDQLSRFQKIIISGSIQRQIPHSLRMHQHVVEIPEINVGQVLRQDLLDFCVKLLSGVLVKLAASLVNQCIYARIGIVAAIGTVRRKLGGMKCVLEDVRVFVAADPAQGIKLVRAAGHVGKEGGEFKCTDVERNAYVAQLLLQDGCDQTRGFLGGSLHDQVKSDVVDWAIAGGIENLPRALGIVLVRGHIRVVRPTLRRQYAPRWLREATPQVLDHRLAVYGIRDGLPYAHVFQNGIAQIECKIIQYGTRSAQYFQIWFAFEREHQVRGQSVVDDISAALAQFKRTRSCIRHYHESYPSKTCLFTPVLLVALEDNFSILLCTEEAKRPRTHRFSADFIAAAVWNNPDRAVGKVPQQRRKRLLHVENDRVVVRRFDTVHEPIGGGLGAANFALQQRVEGPLHIARSQRASVVEFHSVMQMKYVGQAIRNFPPFRQRGFHIEVLVTLQKIIEDQLINTL